MAEPAWDDNRINDYVKRNAERSSQMWTETLRFMRDSYEARLETIRDEISRLRTEIETVQQVSTGALEGVMAENKRLRIDIEILEVQNENLRESLGWTTKEA